MPILIGGGKTGFSRKQLQVIANERGACGDAQVDVLRSRSPSGIYGGGKRVSPTTEAEAVGEVTEVKKVFQNGDIYCGGFADNVPHGQGKYMWIDGCIYDGEWRNGKAEGKGKFSWTSGATFEGAFKGGLMEGYGIFVGANGETYNGSWMADRKHGYGRKSYANGDFYEGQWRKNLQDGQGRYVWCNGNQYIGEWHNGVISGRGLLICANGSRYDGQWEKGVPKKSGVITWPDCCCYTGSGNRNPHSQQQQASGETYATSICKNSGRRSSISSQGESLPRFVPARNRLSVDGATARNSKAVKNVPRICIWAPPGDEGDITCDIVDNIDPSPLYKDGTDFYESENEGQLQCRSNSCLPPCEVKKLGQPISKGHKNHELVLNLQLGIRYSVGKPHSELRPTDFDPKGKFWTRFPLGGSKLTPPHNSTEFKWKDYCPNVFRHLRKLFSVNPEEYIKAICEDDCLRELSSPGKSGSLFYLTQDDRFIIKTVKKCEVKVLLRMLLTYFQHVSKYEDSLVTKFYGTHCVKSSGGQKVRFIVMGNLFCSESRIHRRFDLKGSSHGRSIRKTEENVDENTTLKDLDLDLIFHLQKPWFNKLTWQLERDCEFLESESIMDYSLLVGLHFSDKDLSASMMGISASSQKTAGLHKTFQSHMPLIEFSFRELESQDTARILDDLLPPTHRLGANVPARAQYVCNGRGPMMQPQQVGQSNKVVLYFGIIDILQDYDITKKLEHVYKSLQADSCSISAVDPKLYSSRFRDFIGKIFVEDE